MISKCGFKVLEFEFKDVISILGFTILALINENKIDIELPNEYEINRNYYLQDQQ